MIYSIPEILTRSLADGSWKNVPPEVLRRCLGNDLDDLELFEHINIMQCVSVNLDMGGYVEDPEFCMTREASLASNDPRLMFPRALFIGGSVMAGDDVFVAIQQEDSDEYDPPVLVFDWNRQAPSRWVECGKLSELISVMVLEG